MDRYSDYMCEGLRDCKSGFICVCVCVVCAAHKYWFPEWLIEFMRYE